MIGGRPRYYSQAGEDFLLWKLFKFRPSGFYVDVGAFDGVHLSNSYSFELAGWQGICIEANPDMLERCKVARPRSTCLGCACVATDQIEPVEFWCEPLGLLSSLHPDAADVSARYEKRGLTFEGFERIRVPAMTLDTILDEQLPEGTPLDFVSIDVEGTELDVLRGFDLKRYRPRVVVIEANTEERRQALCQHLVDENDYIEARRLEVNLFFARDRRDAERLRRIRVACWIEPTIHPLGDKFTMKERRRRRYIGRTRTQQWLSWRRPMGIIRKLHAMLRSP
ncbi:MAG: FkbM family methyltransferase [Phycisphaerales bacterium]|nr:MAG: FkbM family methyltransferase [Phycisphaerales bacterium]